jgi:hypothetical protein
MREGESLTPETNRRPRLAVARVSFVTRRSHSAAMLPPRAALTGTTAAS